MDESLMVQNKGIVVGSESLGPCLTNKTNGVTLAGAGAMENNRKCKQGMWDRDGIANKQE